MKKIIFLVFILIFISGCYTGNVTYENKLELEGPFKVTNVVDGDTLDLNSSVRVRLSGINTPETAECYYQEAKDKLKELTLNKVVYLEKDITNKDKYDRLLRYVYVDSKFVNSILVEGGFARVFDKYKEDTKRYSELKLIEARAIENSLGLWACEDTTRDCLYVASKNSKIYHKPDCKWVKRIAPENIICFESLEEVQAKGLKPSKTC